MKDMITHWEYICTYVDDLLVMSKEPEVFMDELQKTFKMKGVGPPTYHLGADLCAATMGYFHGVPRPTLRRS